MPGDVLSHRAALLLFVAWCGAVSAIWPAQAQTDTPAAGIRLYGNLYPEWKSQSFGQPATAGQAVGTMGTKRNDRTALTSHVSAKPETEGQEWSNSHVGMSGETRVQGLRVGFDLQALVDLQGGWMGNMRARDAYVYIDSPKWGRVRWGRMDSPYKDVGDRIKLGGISSGNFISTSQLISGTGWKPSGLATFHNRMSDTWAWSRPFGPGFEVHLSHTRRPVQSVATDNASLSAAALVWSDADTYMALATEVHRNWMVMSYGSSTSLPAASSILNPTPLAGSRDQAWRATVEQIFGAVRLGADVARLHYSESGSLDPGKFRSYDNLTFQWGAEWKLNAQWLLSFISAVAGQGECRLSADVACDTQGMGGRQRNMGLVYRWDSQWRWFVLDTRIRNGAGTFYGSAAQGAPTHILGAGIQYQFK